AIGVARERMAPAARAGEEMPEHVALPDLERALGREVVWRHVGVQHVVRRRAGVAALEAVGEKAPAIRAELERARRLEKPVLPEDGEATAELPRAARVRDVAVALDEERGLGLDHLDGVVREVDDAAAAGT